MASTTAMHEATFRLNPPNPPPGTLPVAITRQADVIVGLMITVGAIVAVIALVAAFILLMIGDEQRGQAGGKIMRIMGGVGGVLAAGALVGLVWNA